MERMFARPRMSVSLVFRPVLAFGYPACEEVIPLRLTLHLILLIPPSMEASEELGVLVGVDFLIFLNLFFFFLAWLVAGSTEA